ncbi:MAG: hypothetical protein KDD94_01255 [Calditrichaeota bacterium]|nr:hypothetical protein [Calditrichota bacterium]
MTNSYDQNSNAEDKIVHRLNQLPHLKAPVNFEQKLMHNIQRLERGEAVKIIQHNSINWKTTSLSIAAGLTIAILGFGNGPSTSPQPSKLANPAIAKETESDSAKEVKQFNKPLNLVNDKKK